MCSPECSANARTSRIRHCTVCNTEYNSASGKARSPFYCGDECRTTALTLKASRSKCANAACPNPNAPLEGGRFCSWECLVEHHPLKAPECRACGEEIPAKPLPLIRMPNYCGPICRDAHNNHKIIAASRIEANPFAATDQVSRYNEWLNVTLPSERGARWNNPLPTHGALPWRFYVEPDPTQLPNHIMRSINLWEYLLTQSQMAFHGDKYGWYAFCVQYGTSNTTSGNFGDAHYLESLNACLPYINTPQAASLRSSPVYRNMLRAYYRKARMTPDKYKRAFDELANLYYQYLHDGADAKVLAKHKVLRTNANGMSVYMLKCHAFTQASKQPNLSDWCPPNVADHNKIMDSISVFRMEYIMASADFGTKAQPAWVGKYGKDPKHTNRKFIAAVDYIAAQARTYAGSGTPNA